MRTALALVLATCALPGTAHAGRSFFGWLYGTEVMPERGVELQTWVQDENDRYGTRSKDTWLWWGPLIGVTDQLELALPLELEWFEAEQADGSTRAAFTFRRFGIEARYRLVPQDPAEAPLVVPLVRLAVKRDVIDRGSVRLEGDAVASYDAGPVHALIDVGLVADLASGSQHFELHPGAGVSISVTKELRVGAEAYSELRLDSEQGTEAASWATAGPDLSWSHGRFWISGALGIGIYHVGIASRVVWGIAF